MTDSDQPGLLDRLRQRHPWLDRIMRAQDRYESCNGDFYAAGITYFTVFALFPLLMVGFAVLVATGIYVHDIDRALSYGFPFILLAVFILIETSSTSSVRLILFFTMVVCVAHPQVFYMGYNKILWLEPLPVKIFMLIDHRLQWGLFS